MVPCRGQVPAGNRHFQNLSQDGGWAGLGNHTTSVRQEPCGHHHSDVTRCHSAWPGTLGTRSHSWEREGQQHLLSPGGWRELIPAGSSQPHLPSHKLWAQGSWVAATAGGDRSQVGLRQHSERMQGGPGLGKQRAPCGQVAPDLPSLRFFPNPAEQVIPVSVGRLLRLPGYQVTRNS